MKKNNEIKTDLTNRSKLNRNLPKKKNYNKKNIYFGYYSRLSILMI